MVNDPKHIGDYAALGAGSAGTLAFWSDLASQLTPILSAVFVFLSILWLGWRAYDRAKYGPRQDRD